MNFCFNYNDKRKIEENYFLKKYKKGKYGDLLIEKINFINKHSVQSDCLRFTNKLQRSSSKRIDAIRNIIKILEMNPTMLNEYFQGEDINQQSEKDLIKLERVDKILKLYEQYPNNSLVYKYAPNDKYYKEYNENNYERGFQLLFTHENNTINVYLIDLYHLAIISKDQDLINEYNIRKKYKKNILDHLFNETSTS